GLKAARLAALEPERKCGVQLDMARAACFAAGAADCDDALFERDVLPFQAGAFCRTDAGERPESDKRNEIGRVDKKAFAVYAERSAFALQNCRGGGMRRTSVGDRPA
ncbi:MAG: hypothetical protein LIO63_05650, partial [Akkermansia sp.]|nr:hypothetical protein [Akkermansia sp.]